MELVTSTRPAGALPRFPSAMPGLIGLLGLGSARLAAAIAVEIRRAVGNPTGVIAICDPLGRALWKAGLPVLIVVPRPRLRKAGPPQIAARLGEGGLPVGEGCTDVAVADGLGPDPIGSLRALSTSVRDGGLVVLATRRGTPSELVSAAMVHAALTDVMQLQVGSALIATGRVRKWLTPRSAE